MMNTDLDQDDLVFWRYKDLVERRIVSGRSDLSRKQQQHGFPRAVKLIGGQGGVALFPRAQVSAWVRKQLSRQAD